MNLVESWLASLAVFLGIAAVGLGFKFSEDRKKKKQKEELTRVAEQSLAAQNPASFVGIIDLENDIIRRMAARLVYEEEPTMSVTPERWPTKTASR